MESVQLVFDYFCERTPRCCTLHLLPTRLILQNHSCTSTVVSLQSRGIRLIRNACHLLVWHALCASKADEPLLQKGAQL